MARGRFAIFLALSLVANAFCLPPVATFRRRRDTSDSNVESESSLAVDNITESKDTTKNPLSNNTKPAATNDDDDDDFDDDFKPTTSSNSGGGSNIFSLLNLASALLPSLSGTNNVKKNNEIINKVIRELVKQYQARKIQKRQDVNDNVIEIDYASELKPPYFERQESDEADDDNSGASESDSEEDNGAEESVEEPTSQNGDPKQDSASNDNASNAGDNSNGSEDDNDSDYDEPPDGDGQGGGILGLLAGLSGDGESDLGTLLATVGGIVANLSGDGIDLNAIIATAIGLFVGLLSDEGTNPGEIIGSYLLTSLDTITGGGAKNNGAFFGKFLSTLVKGTSAAQKTDTTNPPPQMPLWNLKMDILRAVVRYGTSMIGLASSASSSGSSPAPT